MSAATAACRGSGRKAGNWLEVRAHAVPPPPFPPPNGGCPGRVGLWYYLVMNYTPPEPVPESIAASLARGEAQIAAGQTVPLEPVLDRLRSSIARMQADDKLKTPTPEA
jgi:hypothetical protein